MGLPNFDEEKKLWKKGFKRVVGLDEAGRGPLAGPVVAGAVLIGSRFKIPENLKDIKDSKLLSEDRREELYEILTNHPQIDWGVGIVSEKIIDRINILEATKLAMKKSLFQHQSGLDLKPNFLLLDGNFILKFGKTEKNIPQKSIIKGDQKVFSISAASIIAKVTRDRLMRKYHRKYPRYGFLQHKGYPTEAHFASLKKFGPCKIHRKTFYPISQI